MEQKHYELTYIISTAIAETEHSEIKKQVEAILVNKKAVITERQDLGKKKFSYVIDKVRHGFYQSIEFDVEPSAIELINSELKLNNQVLRFLIIHKKILSEEDKAREAKAQEAQEARETKEEEEEPKPKAEPKTKTKKVSLEDLDEKLDQILDSDNLID